MFPTDIFLVRHGESEGNAALRQFEKDKFSVFTTEFLNRHHSHFRLTDKGRAQCPVVGEWLKEWLRKKKLPHFDEHFVSTHTRALETAALLNLPNAKWKTDFQLHERDTGLWGAIPDKKWQKRYDRSKRLGQNHHFYTPWPDGESIADVCNRLRNLVGALDREDVNQKRIIIVAHGDVMQAFRIIFEGILPDRYDELSKANLPDFRIGNGQIIHYTRVDPIDTAKPARTLYDRFGWVRSINPWCPEYAGHDWRAIEQRRYSNAELLAMAERSSRLINE